MTFASALLIALACSSLTWYFVRAQQNDASEDAEARVQAMRDELATRGRVLVNNLALSSQRAIAVLDFLFLTEVIEVTVQPESGIVYGIIMDKDRRAHVHSDKRFAGQELNGPEDRAVADLEKVSAREVHTDNGAVLEVAAPLLVSGEHWGVIRLGLSLAQLNTQIDASRKLTAERSKKRLLAAVLVASALIALASAAAAAWTRSVTRPIEALVVAAQRIEQGDLESRVAVDGPREISALGSSFNAMTGAIKMRDEKLRTALQKAEEASRLKSEFLSNVSHELRTPLNAIVNVPLALLQDYRTQLFGLCSQCGGRFRAESDLDLQTACPSCGNTALLADEGVICRGEPAEHVHFLRRLRQSSRHLLDLVNDLLDFSKLGAKRMVLTKEPLGVRTLAEDVADQLTQLASERGVTLATNVASQVVIDADRLKVSQILINLIGNALKFTPRGGRVEVSAKIEDEAPGFVRFAVKDTGIGIAREHWDTIFDSFRQVDGGHTRQHGGTGLGLTITKQLVELHGGRIWLDSTPGKGTTFFFEIPVFDGSLARPVDKGRLRVVVVEDSDSALELMRLVFEQQGSLVHTVNDPREALATIERVRPGLVVLDIMMPHLSGVSVLEQIRANQTLSDLPVVVCSAYHSHREASDRLSGIWLPKPWDQEALLAIMQRVTHGAV